MTPMPPMTPITPETIAQLNASDAEVVLLLVRETSDTGHSYYAIATAIRDLVDGERSPWSIHASSRKGIADFDFYIVQMLPTAPLSPDQSQTTDFSAPSSAPSSSSGPIQMTPTTRDTIERLEEKINQRDEKISTLERNVDGHLSNIEVLYAEIAKWQAEAAKPPQHDAIFEQILRWRADSIKLAEVMVERDELRRILGDIRSLTARSLTFQAPT